ncbi:MAG: VanZ family protein [Gemmatimonadaceae bacterium]|nr:VanZ family protein [Gemmatimonadaceae bacterium]
MTIARRWAPSVVWGMGILALTSLPGSALPVGPAIPGTDKLVHAALYAVLASLVAHAVPGQSMRAMLVVGGALALFAAADEWHQRWIPGRSADMLDWVADMSGAVVGYTYSSRSAPRRRETRT